MFETIDRRQWLGSAAALSLSSGIYGLPLLGQQPVAAPASHRPRPKVAAIFTELRFRSHAFNILENFFAPYLFNGQLVDPGCDVVSFFADQFPMDDMAREAARRLNVPLFKTIDEALCLGGKNLAVDAVLIVGEHGDYPYNELGQHLYPRKQFFDQALAVMQRSNRFVPLFNDKHYSYRWDWAREMFETARRHKMPLLAGSSVPLAERRPPLELPAGSKFTSAVAVHGGGAEVYGFHGLELLQSFVEARRGGETGIQNIELLSGDRFQRLLAEDRTIRELLDAALAAESKLPTARQSVTAGSKKDAASTATKPPDPVSGDHAILVNYRDGLRAAVIRQAGSANRWNFACRLQGENQPRVTALFNSPWGNRGLFKALSHAIQSLFINRKEPYPAERTLLTTGAIEAAMQSHAAKMAIDTPHLAIRYQPNDWRAFRELGASWQKITADTPQPMQFEPGDEKLLSSKRE